MFGASKHLLPEIFPLVPGLFDRQKRRPEPSDFLVIYMRFHNILRVFVLAGALVAQPSFASDPIDTVYRLYMAFSWEAVIDEPDSAKQFSDQSGVVLRQFLTPELAKLLQQDRKCAARTHEICRMNFMPLWASQDPGATELKIVNGSHVGEVVVSFIYPSTQEKVSLRYVMVNHGKGWRVSDILYAEGVSLKKILSGRESGM